MSERIPLDLYHEVITADGARYKWDANQTPGSRLRNFSFSTKVGDGFSDATGQLARFIDLDYPDLELVAEIVTTGADGSTAYEGRIAAMPRELGDTHTINVSLAGHMAHATDRTFREVYVDRDTGAWGAQPIDERARLVTAGVDIASLSWASDMGALIVALPNQALGANVEAQDWYIAPPGVLLAKIAYKGTATSIPGGYGAPAFVFNVSDLFAGGTSEVLATTLDNALHTLTATNARRYVYATVYSNGTVATPAAGAALNYTKVAAYGNHGLTLHTGDPTEPDGVYASDVMRDIVARFCPKLNAGGVQNTDYVIQNLAFKDRTSPFDAFTQLNKYHLWHLGVWENKTVTFRPYDLSDYDWEIRTDDPGTTFSPVGPTTDDLFNGIVVTYTDLLTGVEQELSPSDYPTLQDTSVGNPWNAEGINHWTDLQLSQPTLQADALQLGVVALADKNRPKTAGTITVKGYIRDRQGHELPGWKVRAGDVICITNFNEINRLIVEATWSDEDKTLTIAVDLPFQFLDALLDRQQNALSARGL